MGSNESGGVRPPQGNPAPAGVHVLSPHPLALAVALLTGGVLTAGVTPSTAATLDVADGEVAISANGRCSLIEALVNATNTVSGAVHGDCAAGDPAGADTLNLAENSVYTLTAVRDTEIGATGLPVASGTLTLNGNGATIERGAGAPAFRLLRVAVGSNLTINDLTLRNGLVTTRVNNSAQSIGGGAILNRGTLTLNNSVVTGNRAQYGGGIDNISADFTLNTSIVNDNEAQYGGGLYNFGFTEATLTASTVSGNRAGNGGGGIANIQSAVSLINSTVSGNSAASKGGGIYNYDIDSSVSLLNSTIADNSSSAGAALYNSSGNTFGLTNTLVTGGSGVHCAGGVSPVVNGDNVATLFGDASCDGAADGDAGLGPLADNGGPTPTHALLAGSAAIDAGSNTDCPATDQRGFGRRDGQCDIGAFELGGSAAPLFQDDFEAGPAAGRRR